MRVVRAKAGDFQANYPDFNATYPVMITFTPYANGGKVIYTSFHNDEQQVDVTTDMTMILDYAVFM